MKAKILATIEEIRKGKYLWQSLIVAFISVFSVAALTKHSYSSYYTKDAGSAWLYYYSFKIQLTSLLCLVCSLWAATLLSGKAHISPPVFIAKASAALWLPLFLIMRFCLHNFALSPMMLKPLILAVIALAAQPWNGLWDYGKYLIAVVLTHGLFSFLSSTTLLISYYDYYSHYGHYGF